MKAVFALLALLLLLFLIALVARLVLEYVQLLARDWKPRSAALVVSEVVYTVTDPPLRFLRRFIKPLRLGAVSLDLSFLVLILAVSIGWQTLTRAAT